MHWIPSGAKLATDKITQTRAVRKAFIRRTALAALFLFGAAALFSAFCPISRAVSGEISSSWCAGWSRWKAGDAAGAYERWQSADALLPFSKRSARFYYWRIRALEKMERREEASKLASLLALRHPLSFYSFALGYTGRYPALSEASMRAAAGAPYERRWEREVASAAAATGVSKNVLWALIKQESKFNASAVSRNGAVGLMQLMPFTAKEAAARLKNESLTPYVPTHNIMLGSAHFLHLKKTFSGNTVLAAAAYNAGPSAVGRWPRGGSEWMEWIEDIPYPQTREYLKAVLANIEVYSASSPCPEDEESFFTAAEKKAGIRLRSAGAGRSCTNN